jgi:S1/P1 Nuclease
MRSRFSVGLGLAAALYALAVPTLNAAAWDATGHQQVADIAWAQLTPEAKKAVGQILMAGDPQFRPASTAEADVRAAFRKAATFPDVIKGDRTTDYEAIIPDMNLTFFKKDKPNPANNEHVLCKTWHYYDTPIRAAGAHPVEDSNALNAFGLARMQFSTLQKAAMPDRKMQCWWLYWLEHITGDLHQPLHCVSSYEFFPDTGDAGGNRLRVMDPKRPGRPSPLHGYWDGGITHAIATERKAEKPAGFEDITARWLADPKLKPASADATKLDAAAWIKEGAAAADKVVYRDLKQNSELTDEYAAAQEEYCKKAAVLGGTRLARLLNSMLK